MSRVVLVAALLAPVAALELMRIKPEVKDSSFRETVGKDGQLPFFGAGGGGDAGKNAMCMQGYQAPQVFILGYQKAGTTSLWGDLKTHFGLAEAHWMPGDQGYVNKELTFFGDTARYKRGKEFYLQHFPSCTKSGKTLDASPNTIFAGKKATERLKAFYGSKAKGLRFVIIARDPANRMESAYYDFFKDNGVYKNFDDYVKKTIDSANSWAHNHTKAPALGNLYWPSMYIKQMKTWLEVFEPKQFAFITLQQYKEQTAQTMKFLSDRLGLPYKHASDREAKEHIGHHQKMSDETRKKLNKFFAPFTAQLEELVKAKGIGLPHGDLYKMNKFRQLLTTAEDAGNRYLQDPKY